MSSAYDIRCCLSPAKALAAARRSGLRTTFVVVYPVLNKKYYYNLTCLRTTFVVVYQ